MRRTTQSRVFQILGMAAIALALITGSYAQRIVAGPLLQTEDRPISISCDVVGDTERAFSVSLLIRNGQAPSGTVTLTRIDGTTETVPFTGGALSFSGDYVAISVSATWPDGATASASATCGQSLPTPTPQPTATPTSTPRPTNTPGPTRTPTPIGAPTATPRPTRTPTQTAQPTATPIPISNVRINITCDLLDEQSDIRRFVVVIEPRAAGLPNGRALLTLLNGGAEERTFSENRVEYVGQYRSINVTATWADGATAFAGSSCAFDVPPPTPTVVAATPTPPAEATPAPTTPPREEETPAPTAPPREEETPAPTAPPREEATPTPTAIPVTETATPAETVVPTETPVAAIETPTETTGSSGAPGQPPTQAQEVAGASDEDEAAAQPPRQEIAGASDQESVLPAVGRGDATAQWWRMISIASWIVALGAGLRVWHLRRESDRADDSAS